MPDNQDNSITIAIPYYKGPAFLDRAMQSVRRQTSTAWQLIVCDDSGTEFEAKELVARFDDPRIRYYCNERNLGMAGNWNRCLDLAPTDLVNLLHHDDELLPNYVECMCAAARAHPQATAFFCRAKVIDGEGRDTFSFVDFVKRFIQPQGDGDLCLTGRSAIEALMHGDFIMCPTVCYRRSLLKIERFRPEWKQVLDLDFFVRILLAGGALVGLPQVAYAYRRHDGNATKDNTRNLSRFEEESRLHDEVAIACRERGWQKAADIARGKRVILAHLLFTIAGEMCSFRRCSAISGLRLFRRLLKTSRMSASPRYGKPS